MSGYGKNQEQYVYENAATRPNQAPSYPGLAQPSFASQYTDAPTRASHEPSGAEMPYIPSSTYESRGRSSYQPESPFIDARSRHPAPRSTIDPEVTNVVAPSQGTAGSTLVLHLRTKFDLINDPEPNTFFFMFNAKRCEAALQKMGQVDDYYNYALSVQVPPFPLTNSWDPKMMLKLRMENSDGQTLHEVDAGSFTFVDMSPTLAYQSSPELAKKRKYSTTEFGEPQDYENAAKRANSMRLLAKPRAMSAAYSQASASTLPVQPSLTSTYGYPGGYDMVKQSSYTSQLPQKSLYAIPASMDMKPPQLSPSLPSYTQYSSLAHTGRSPSSIAATPARTSIMSSPATMPTPVLVRATTLPQSATGPAGLPFNPYSIYPSKAKLEIDGDLNTMMEDWTRDELEAKRRLVQFERSQTGSTITTTFMPVTPEARPTRSICVSCIFWEEKNEYFITSVDAIYLLEQLVNVRFTVEEKNRIRRNLEGFRPMTVSKAKADSEEFFKVIMGFPNPKPRNIEKDVKVFHWNILSHALKKIIGKYTASYASTAGAGSHPASSSAAYVPVGIPQTAGDGLRNMSPRSVASSAASNAYTPHMASTSLSPKGSAGQVMSVSQRDPTSHGMTQWGPATHQQVPQYTTGMPAGARGSWDYGAYLNAPTATGVPAAAQSMHMQRPNVTSDISQMPPENPYQQYGQRTTRV